MALSQVQKGSDVGRQQGVTTDREEPSQKEDTYDKSAIQLFALYAAFAQRNASGPFVLTGPKGRCVS